MEVCTTSNSRILQFVNVHTRYLLFPFSFPHVEQLLPLLLNHSHGALMRMCFTRRVLFFSTNAPFSCSCDIPISLSFLYTVSVIGHELRCTNRLFLFISWFLSTRWHYRHSRSWVGPCHLRGQASSDLSRTPSCSQISSCPTRELSSHQDM
jgi:hypothetical protein